MDRRLVYFAWWGLWALTALPMAVFSFWWFRELPMWPHFSESWTLQGATIWVLFVTWIYLLPLGLLLSRRWWLSRA